MKMRKRKVGKEEEEEERYQMTFSPPERLSLLLNTLLGGMSVCGAVIRGK